MELGNDDQMRAAIRQRVTLGGGASFAARENHHRACAKGFRNRARGVALAAGEHAGIGFAPFDSLFVPDLDCECFLCRLHRDGGR